MGALTSLGTSEPADLIVSRNPKSGEPLGEVRESSAAEIRLAVERARGAQKSWGTLSVRERCLELGRFRDAIVAHADELAQRIHEETGKTKSEALAMEVLVVADLASYFLKRALRILAPEPLSTHLLHHRKGYVHYAPRGVVGIIAPWNFPFGIGIGEVMMALIAGNGVVLKPSEVTPLISLRTKELYDATGLPPDLFQVVPGRGAAGAALIDSGIDYCVFTGSTATGRKVGAACGERLIPCTLELGGKAPAIVCADADVERTAKALVWGAFANQGQVCVSVERVYAHEALHDRLVGQIVAEVEKLRPDRDLGTMTWETQRAIVEERVAAAVAAGAKVRTGGQRRGPGLGYLPTVLSDCQADMEVMHKEIFGPVMPIMKVRDDEEALRLANDSRLGLMAYVFTRDRQHGRQLAERVEAGMTTLNDCLILYGIPESPWGGIKDSGIGVTHSERGLRELCQARVVNYDRLALKRELWWYPYSDTLYRQTLKVMRWLFR